MAKIGPMGDWDLVWPCSGTTILDRFADAVRLMGIYVTSLLTQMEPLALDPNPTAITDETTACVNEFPYACSLMALHKISLTSDSTCALALFA